MNKQDIRNLSFEELIRYFASVGEEPFRATQIFDWIYKKGADNFNEMSNLPSSLKNRLTADFLFKEPELMEEEASFDHTMKFLFSLADKERIEAVLIPTSTRMTVCVSTQAGCKFGCRFCASGIGGWARDLSCAEILSQILYVKNIAKEKSISHIVFMGVGEPLDNYDNLIKAIRIINAKKGMNIAVRRITISTCGLIPQIKKLAQENMQVELAISLHGSSNESRNVLMPVNKKYPIRDLIEACKEYIKATKRQITFEYILIKDVTCTDSAAKELGRLLKGIVCKMNLIPYNKVAEFEYEPPSRNKMVAFRNRLDQFGIHATIRTPRGQDVSAACGQLRHTPTSRI